MHYTSNHRVLLSTISVAIMLASCGQNQTEPLATEIRSQIPPENKELSRTSEQHIQKSELTKKAVSLEHLPSPYQNADYAKGKKLFVNCASCHSLIENKNTTGPSLYGMFGSTVGLSSNFNYSDALKNADFIWTPDQLDTWIEKPGSMLPGNRMNFAGMRRPEQRLDLIAYLMIETENKP